MGSSVGPLRFYSTDNNKTQTKCVHGPAVYIWQENEPFTHVKSPLWYDLRLQQAAYTNWPGHGVFIYNVYKFRGKQPADGPLTTPPAPPSPGRWERKTTLPLHPSVRPPPCQSAGLAAALFSVIIVCLSVLGAAGASNLCLSGSPPPRSPSSVWSSASPAAISASGTSSPRGTRRHTSALSCMLISKLKSFRFRRWR